MAFSKARRLSDFIASDGTIPTGKFATGTITSDHIADLGITHADLHTNMDLTGKTVLVANASTGDSDTTAANTAFVQQEIAALVDSSPSALNTLNELAAALGDDANFSTTVTNSIATKLPLAGGTMSGPITMSQSGALHNQFTSTGSSSKISIISADGEQAYINYSGATNEMSAGYDRTSSSFRFANGDTLSSAIRMQINSTGNVGINTTDQIGEKLTVNGAVQVLGNNDPNYSAKFSAGYDSTHCLRITTRINDTSESEVLGVFANSGGAAPRLALNPTNGWNVGIGTTNPSTKLTVKNDSASTSFGDNNIITIQNANTTDNSRMGLAFTGNTNIGSGLALVEAQSYDQSAGHTSLNFSVYNGSWHNDMMVLKAGNVGIGETVPQTKLHVKSGDSGGTVYNAGYNPIVIETPSHGGLQILTPNNRNGLIYFGDNDNAVIGRIEYSHSTDTFEFVTAGVARATLSNVSLSSTVKITAPSFIPSTGYNIEYLVVGGGGGGGSTVYDDCGGGGAGGYRSSIAGNPSANYGPPEPPVLAVVGKTYAVTVGAGGNLLGNGNGSSFGLIESAGGGRAGNHRSRGHPGGSGGGGSGFYAATDNVEAGVGYYGQGNNGGTVTNYSAAGGGGGAGAPGQGGSGSSKAGGDGVWSVVESGISLHIGSQTSNRVYRAAGGGGYAGGAGGTGGGGRGWSTTAVPTAGAVNTGSGGGGNKENHTYSATVGGGSGIVILKVPTSNYTGTTTGSPTVTTVGSYKILKFTSSGSYTA